MKIGRNFFERKTLIVAKELLGKYLVRSYRGRLLIGKIVETEAYIGPRDKASHAYSKKEQSVKEKLKVIEENWKRIKNYIDNKEVFIRRILKLKKAKVTKRNLAEYLRGGHIYIYLVYGNYYQLNITTYKEGYPECVLIRSLEPILNLKNPKGPGKLCKELKLDSSFWGEDLIVSKRIWLEDNVSLGSSPETTNFDSQLDSLDAPVWPSLTLWLKHSPTAYPNLVRRNCENSTEMSRGKQTDEEVSINSRESLQQFVTKNIIIRTTRIGIDYAEEHKFLKWRFYIKNNKWISKK